MKEVQLQYSKSKIDQAGQLLKKIDDLNPLELEESLEILSNWRAYHALPLDIFAKALKSRVNKIDKSKNSIVAQRLKRTPSILLKLQTKRTMRLSAMQDIGGLRAIFESVDEVYQLLDYYKFSKTKHHFSSIDDYIKEPKADGYRGIHLIYKVAKTPSVFIEIQIRSHLQHIWATGVEVFGTLKNSSFKSGHGDEKWLEFFTLVSSVFALKENRTLLDAHKSLSKSELLKKTKAMIQELQVIEQLNIYTKIYQTQLNYTQGRKGNYSLILLNSKENKITLETFSTNEVDAATKQYLDLEKQHFDNQNINVVLVNIGDIKKLKLSYPNYFMDTEVLVRNLSLIKMNEFL